MTDDGRRVIASPEAEQQQLVFARFDNGDAWQLGSAMVAAAIKRSLPVTIDIRRHGQQLFHAALPGTTPENDSWIERKVKSSTGSPPRPTSWAAGSRRVGPH